MPLLNSVTTPYAEAFLQVANDLDQTEEIVTQVKEIINLVNESPDLEKAFSSPILEKESKKEILIQLFSEKINQSLLNLLKLLADRQRIGIIIPILERFLELYRENRNIALAKVTSAVELSDEQKDLIKNKISAIAGTERLELVTKTDSTLIGGFIVSVGSKVIDASLSSQIRKLGLSLSK